MDINSDNFVFEILSHADFFYRSKKAMLPSVKNLSLFNESSRNDDNQNQSHDDSIEKRSRIFPNIRNQFVIHIYYHLDDNTEILQEIRQQFVEKWLNFENEWHISFVYGHYAVQYHQIEPLLCQLSELIKSFESFSLCLNNVRILPNSDKSRYFLAICQTHSDDDIDNEMGDNEISLKKLHSPLAPNRVLIKSIHHIIRKYRSEIVPVDDSQVEKFIYHTSIAWFTPEHVDEAQKICDKLNQNYFNDEDDDRILFIRIDRIHLKIGHISRIINLL